jgi:hypothetical protein
MTILHQDTVRKPTPSEARAAAARRKGEAPLWYLNPHFSPGGGEGLQTVEEIGIVAHKQKTACFQRRPVPVRNAD